MIEEKLCESKLSEKINNLYDDRYAYPGKYTMLECKDSGHLQLDAGFSDEQLGDLYSNYYPRADFNIDDWTPHFYKTGFTVWLNGLNCSAYRWVPPNIKILDVGCGFGETLGFHRSRGCEVYGVEADSNIQRVGDKYGFNVKVGLFNADDYPKEYFDYVTLDQVIEHVRGPLQVLKDVHKILKPGGTLILSTPNAKGWGIRAFGRKWIHWHTPYHLQIFSKESLEKHARLAGFALEKAKTITHSDWLYFQWIHLVTRPSFGKISNFWNPEKSGKRSFVQKLAVTFFSLLHLIKVNHFITRIFDAMNLGDNQLYFLKKI